VSVWVGVPTAITIVLITATIRRSKALLWVAAIAMGILFVPCGGVLLMHQAGKGPDGAGLAPWGVAAHLIGMFLALPAVIVALCLPQGDSRH
jgi:hypothetical protein